MNLRSQEQENQGQLIPGSNPNIMLYAYTMGTIGTIGMLTVIDLGRRERIPIWFFVVPGRPERGLGWQWILFGSKSVSAARLVLLLTPFSLLTCFLLATSWSLACYSLLTSYFLLPSSFVLPSYFLVPSYVLFTSHFLSIYIHI